MALKREQQQVDYATKISVNRGTGFNSLANAYKSRANTFENLTDSFAKVMLNEIQTRGKKIGEDAAENVEFVTNNNGALVPVENFVPVTRTSQAAYEKDLSARYILETVSAGNKIIADIETEFRNNRQSHTAFDAEVSSQIDALTADLPADVRNLAVTQLANQQFQAYNRVMTTYMTDQRAQADKQSEYSYDVLVDKALRGMDPEEFQESYDLLNNTDWYTRNKSMLDPELKGLQEFGMKLYQPYLAKTVAGKPFTEQTAAELSVTLVDIARLETLVYGLGDVTFSDGKTFTKEDIDRMITPSARSKIQQLVNAIKSDVNYFEDLDRLNTLVGPGIVKSFDEGPGVLAGFDQTTLIRAIDDQVDSFVTGFTSKYPIEDNPKYYTDGRININDSEVAQIIFRTTGVFPSGYANVVENAITRNDEEDIEQLGNSGFFDTLFQNTRIITYTENGETFRKAITYNPAGNTNISQKLIAKASVIKNRIDRGESYRDIAMHLERVKQAGFSDYTTPITTILKQTGRYNSLTELKQVIQKSLDDELGDIKLPDGTKQPAIKNMRVSQMLYGQVEEYVIDYIRAGGLVDRDRDVENLVNQFIDGAINNETSMFGISRYNWSGNSLSPFAGDILDEDVNVNSYTVALFPLEKQAEVDGNHTWIEPIVNNLIKDADQFADGVPADAVLGDSLRVDPIDDIQPVVYHIIYEDNGVITELTINGIPALLEIDKEKEKYTDGRNTLVETNQGEEKVILSENEQDTDVYVTSAESRVEKRGTEDPLTLSEVGTKVTDVIKDAGKAIADAVKVDDFVIKDANLDLLQQKLAELKRAKKTKKNETLMLAIEAEINRKINQ